VRAETEITKLLDELHILCDSPENMRRRSLWLEGEPPVRGETQWHGIPGGSALRGEPMPVTAECLNTLWRDLLGLRFDRYYTEPDYFLKHYLRIKILKFREFQDDTPIDRNIPLHFGIGFEAGMLGQEIHYSPDEEPWLGTAPVISETSDLTCTDFDFKKGEVLSQAVDFYDEVRRIVGEEFTVQFPQWIRGPQGVALYLRGFENFLTDLYLAPELCRQTLRYVTEAQKSFLAWRAEFLEEPIRKCDLFNDDLPIMSPASFREFVLPCENELCDFCRGIYYYHSCGDITRHIPEIEEVIDIELLDLGVSMEDKGPGLRAMRKSTPVEVRVRAQGHVQEADEADMARYMSDILTLLGEKKVDRYVLRTSGMSVLLGAEQDLMKLKKWIDITRTVMATG
jgi:hypothetical protein